MKFLVLTIAFNFLIISLKTQQNCGKFSFNSGLIVNGDDIKKGEYPFLVALLKIKNQKFFCAASLITQKHALTGKKQVL